MSFDNKIKGICDENGLIDPVELLTGLSNGVDLRKNGLVYAWLLDFEDEEGGNLPSLNDWFELKSLIKIECRRLPVSMAESLTAQKALIEYMHSKRKSVDITTRVDGDGVVTPLTLREIKKFNRKFNSKV